MLLAYKQFNVTSINYLFVYLYNYLKIILQLFIFLFIIKIFA